MPGLQGSDDSRDAILDEHIPLNIEDDISAESLLQQVCYVLSAALCIFLLSSFLKLPEMYCVSAACTVWCVAHQSDMQMLTRPC